MVYYPKCLCVAKMVLADFGANIQQPQPVSFQPVSAAVRINSYVEADTFSVTARYEDFPFDPRLIRSMLITISIFNSKDISTEKAEKVAIMAGFADAHNISLDASARTVQFDGRDYTSLFIDTRFDNANLNDDEGRRLRKIKLARPLVSILEDLKSNVAGAEKIQIEDRTQGAVQNFTRASGGNYDLVNGQKSQYGQVEYVQPNETYWDVISSICEAAGVICYIELDKLVLTTPRILYQSEGFSSKKAVPFIYGKNIERLEFHKNLSKKKRFNVVVRSLNRRTSETTSLSIPRDATAGWIQATNVEKAVQQVLSLDSTGAQVKKPAPAFVFRFIDKTKEELVSLGEGIFEQFVRQQLEGSMVTREMTINDGTEIDLTQLKIGTPILIEMAQKDMQYINRKSPEGENISDAQRVAYLLRRGYNPETAAILVQALAAITGKIKPTFYMRGCELAMHSDGFQLTVDFINFVVLGERTSQGVKSG